MDKLKAQLAPVAKHWFWITTGLVLIGSIAIWWMASGQLVSEFEAARSKIEGNAQAVTGVSSKISEHPNPKTHEEMQKLIDARKQAVLEAWTSVYQRQQDILVWPVAELQEDFVREFEVLTPIELKVPFPTPEEQEKETTLLNRYSTYIGNVLPGIAEIAKTKWTAKFERSAGSSGMSESYDNSASMSYSGSGVLPEEGPLVKWDTASQEALLKDLFPWLGGQPSTLEVLYSQENLWILRQLMEIIAKVNGDAGQRFQAKIHDINRISIGSSVSSTAGTISKPSTGEAGMMGMDMGMDMGMGSEAMGMDMSMSTVDPSMGGGMLTEVDPGDNRYVDTAGKPLLASQLRSALASNSPTDAFMAVAKRIPVMMSLKMDQRSIPELIAKCGSARLMVEVRQVRILPAGKSSVSGMGGMGDSGGYESSSMDSYSGGGMDMGGGYGGMDMSGGSPGAAGKEQFPMDLDVEVYGIIYIYNPPLEEKLGIEQVTEETVDEVSALAEGRTGETETAAAPVATETLPPPDTATGTETAPATAVEQPLPAPGATAPAETLPATGAAPVEAIPPATAPPATAPPAAASSPEATPPGAAPPGQGPPAAGATPAPAAAAPPATGAPPANAGASWTPASTRGLGFQPGVPRGLGFQPGVPRGLGFQPGIPRGLGFQPGDAPSYFSLNASLPIV